MKPAQSEKMQRSACQASGKLTVHPRRIKLTEQEELAFERIRLAELRSKSAGITFGGKVNLRQMSW